MTLVAGEVTLKRTGMAATTEIEETIQGHDPKEDRGLQRDHKHKLDGDGNSSNHDRGVKQEHQVDGSNDVHSAARNLNPDPDPDP